jgi:hypothetical protein
MSPNPHVRKEVMEKFSRLFAKKKRKCSHHLIILTVFSDNVARKNVG